MTYQEINSNLSIDNLPNETFKDILNYEGLYQVSNLGRVKRLERIKVCEMFNKYGSYGIKNKQLKEKIIKLNINKYGYLYVSIWKNNKSKNNVIHRLVLLTFNGKSNLSVNHIDGNKENNNLNNLEYCTCKENTNHAIKIGLINFKGKNNPNYKHGGYINSRRKPNVII